MNKEDIVKACLAELDRQGLCIVAKQDVLNVLHYREGTHMYEKSELALLESIGDNNEV